MRLTSPSKTTDLFKLSVREMLFDLTEVSVSAYVDIQDSIKPVNFGDFRRIDGVGEISHV